MGGGLTVGGVVMALVFLSATPAFSDPSVEQLNTAVKGCVEVTRRGENPGQTWHFDAYYNAATSRIHNNLDQLGYVPQRAYLFAFEKCMAERGFPLGSKNEGK